MSASGGAANRVMYRQSDWWFTVAPCETSNPAVTHLALAKPRPFETYDPMHQDDDTWFAYGGSAAEALMFVHGEVLAGTQQRLA